MRDSLGHDALEMDTLTTAPARPASTLSEKPLSRMSLARKDYLIGIALLLVVVILWTSSNFVTQDLFERGYQKPFLVTYLSTSAFAVYLLPYSVRILWRRHRSEASHPDAREDRIDEEFRPLITGEEMEESQTPESRRPPTPESRSPVGNLAPLTMQETAKLAMTFCFFWFIANWSVNASLDFTSVASATILSSMSGFFTLGIGYWFGVEILTIPKIGAVLMSFFGVFLVSLSDSSKPKLSRPSSPAPSPKTVLPSNPIIGDSFALLSAVFYALYVILLKVRIHSESRIDMPLFFGFVGLFTFLMGWPVGIILHLMKVEKFELPSTRTMIIALVANMAVTVSSDYLYVLAMLKTTPLVVTVGLSLTIPLAILGDLILGKTTATQAVAGAALVLISFVVVGIENSRLPEATHPDTDLVDDRRGAQSHINLDVDIDR